MTKAELENEILKLKAQHEELFQTLLNERKQSEAAILEATEEALEEQQTEGRETYREELRELIFRGATHDELVEIITGKVKV